MARIALVTCEELKELEPDDRRLQELLGLLDIQAIAAVWDDPAVDWQGFDLILLRTCWDYYLKLPGFLDWLNGLEDMGVPCLNPLALVRWNHHKGYLKELQDRGLPVVPLRLLPKGKALHPETWFEELGSEKLVVKPAVSAGSWNTFVFEQGDQPAGWEEFQDLNQTHDFLVQPFLEAIVAEGELSLVFMGGQFSHAVLKTVGVGDFRVQHQFGGKMARVEPEEAALALGWKVLGAVPEPWFYGRVDLVKEGGQWLVMEVELIEPAMFFEFAPEGLEAFAGLIGERV